MRQAIPRNNALLDTAYGFKGISGGTYSGGGSSFGGYWDLITKDPSGNDLPEAAWYIATKYHAMSEGGLSAYGINPNAPGGGGPGPGSSGLVDFQITGDGNAITSGTYVGGVLYLHKGLTFLTDLPLLNQLWTLVTKDSSGNDLAEKDFYIKTKYHAVSEGGISAYGVNTSGGGGSSGGGGLDDFRITGTGNSITSGTYINGILTLDKGLTFATVSQLHTHSNMGVLDGITSTKVGNWDVAYTNSHTHANKSVLDGITSTKVSNWDSSFSNSHTHANKSFLDLINQDLSLSGNPSFAAFIQIGSIRLQFDSANNAIRVVTSSGGNANFYATGGVSAYGYGSGSGGSGGDNNYLTGVSGSGNGTVTFTRNGLSSLTWDASHSHSLTLNTSGTGNVVSNITVSGLTITKTMTNVGSGGITSISGTHSGSGNAIASVTGTNGSTVVGSLGWFYNAISLSGTGTVLTGVSASNGTLTFTRGAAGSGAISQIQQYYGPSLSLNATLVSNGCIRCGYLNGMSGTIANNSYSDVGICWAVSSSNCLGIAATIQRPNYDIGGITVTWRWQGTGLQFTIHNRSGSSLSLSDVCVSFVAICNT
jgi:hypothetical protein